MVLVKIKKGTLVLFLMCLGALGLILKFLSAPDLLGIPLMLTSRGTPALSIDIEGERYLTELDLGSKLALTLDKELLENIKTKKKLGLSYFRDAQGNSYETPSFQVPYLKLDKFVYKDVKITENSPAFKANTTLWSDIKEGDIVPNPVLGSLGRPILEKTNLLIDFPNRKVFTCSNLKQLRKCGFLSQDMLKVPFKEGRKGIIIEVETDIGMLRLGLDTGSTITLARNTLFNKFKCSIDERKFSLFTSDTFQIKGKNFGTKNIFLYPITEELDYLDGVIGMDFLINHAVYIDYQNHYLYLL